MKNRFVQNQGDAQVGVPKPYPISYRSIVPRSAECKIYLSLSRFAAGHTAFGFMYMGPVFMMAGQLAATAAALGAATSLCSRGKPRQPRALKTTAKCSRLIAFIMNRKSFPL